MPHQVPYPKATSKKRLERGKEASLANIWRESISGKGKGYEMKAELVCLKLE